MELSIHDDPHRDLMHCPRITYQFPLKNLPMPTKEEPGGVEGCWGILGEGRGGLTG